MNQHYRIHEHISTMRALRNRTHEWDFHGVERIIMVLVLLLKLCFPSFWIRHYADMHSHRLRNEMIEQYVIIKTVLIVLILWCGRWSQRWWVAATVYLMWDLVTYLLWLIVLSNLHHSQPNLRRNLILLGINMIEIIAAFGVFYLASGSLHATANGQIVTNWLQAFYFSIATFATVGYGDMVVSWTRWYILSILQVLTSLLFISLVFSSVASKLEITSEW
jgi:Ion channel